MMMDDEKMDTGADDAGMGEGSDTGMGGDESTTGGEEGGDNATPAV